MGFQEIIVSAVGILVLLYVIRRVYCMLKKKDFSACYGCDKDCPMKKAKRKTN